MNGQYNPEEEKTENTFGIIPSEYSPHLYPIKKDKKVLIIVSCILAVLIAFIIVFIVLNNKSPNPTFGYITIKGERYSTSLTNLELSNNGLQNEDIIPLKYMTSLMGLDLYDNPISDWSPVAHVSNVYGRP